MRTLSGHCIQFRLAQPEDAEYIHRLRTHPAIAKHLSPVTGTVEDQAEWIRRYKRREMDGSEFYFVIERHDETPCGVVRLYDIQGDTFTWGSWILDHNKPPKAALDSAVLLYEFAFNDLGLSRTIFDVRKANARVVRFHDRFGATRTGEDAENVYYELRAEDFSPLSFLDVLNPWEP